MADFGTDFRAGKVNISGRISARPSTQQFRPAPECSSCSARPRMHCPKLPDAVPQFLGLFAPILGAVCPNCWGCLPQIVPGVAPNFLAVCPKFGTSLPQFLWRFAPNFGTSAPNAAPKFAPNSAPILGQGVKKETFSYFGIWAQS